MSKFEKWVKDYGVNALSADLRKQGQDCWATPSAVYQWLYGTTEPRAAKMRAMIKLGAGKLTLDDIHAHIEIARRRRERSQQAPAAATPKE